MTITTAVIESLFDRDGNYIEWRRTRIEKVESLFGKDFFKGKKMLELGCAMGHTGRHFEELGATVTFAEGRPRSSRPSTRSIRTPRLSN